MKILNTKAKRWVLVTVLLAVLAGAGYVGVRRYAGPALKARRLARMNQEAADFLAKGDVPNALLMARKSLQSSLANPAAWRIAAQAAKARESAEAVGYQASLCEIAPTRENQLELIRLSLRFNTLANAVKAVAALAVVARDDPAYQDLAAQVERRMGRAVEARDHLAALARLRPADEAAQLDLAEADLAGDAAQKNSAVRPRLLALAQQPGLRARALALLLHDSVTARRADDARGFARQMQALPLLSTGQRAGLVEGLLFAGEPDAGPELARLQAASTGRGDDAAQVIDVLARAGQPRQGYAWFATLPEATRKLEAPQRAAAEALLAAGDWAALDRQLRNSTWTDNEFLRQALLARAARAEGRAADFAQAWELALIAGGSDVRKSLSLLARTEEWGWQVERYDVVWKLFGLLPNYEPAQQALALWEKAHGNTANLRKVFARIVEVAPHDLAARNNLTYTSLLLDSNLGPAELSAAALAAGDPKNPFYATTNAFALYKQGRAAAALQRMDEMRVSDQMMPERMLLHGLFAAFAGDATRAANLIDGVVTRDLLPEEKALIATARGEIARLEKMQGNSARLQARRGEGGKAGGGWLALLGAETRAAATTDMQLADSLYAARDWPALDQLLRAGAWKNDDYLRLALIAYESRQRAEPAASQQAWRQSLATADRAVPRVQNLQRLAADWDWAPERLETLNTLFARDPSDRALLGALLAHYREVKRTTELVRVLNEHVGLGPAVSDEGVELAYYSLLCDVSVARAHVAARNAYTAVPATPDYRLVYAFSLWKQKRSAEARALLDGAKPGDMALVPLPLLRAAILTDTGAVSEARKSLAAFDATRALPEEAALAAALGRRLAALAGP
jgi:hypothetical protein